MSNIELCREVGRKINRLQIAILERRKQPFTVTLTTEQQAKVNEHALHMLVSREIGGRSWLMQWGIELVKQRGRNDEFKSR